MPRRPGPSEEIRSILLGGIFLLGTGLGQWQMQDTARNPAVLDRILHGLDASLAKSVWEE